MLKQRPIIIRNLHLLLVKITDTRFMNRIIYPGFFGLVLLLLISSTSPASAQCSFSSRNDLLPTGIYHSGLAIGIADMNQDGYDDIIRLAQGRTLMIEYQQTDGSTFQTQEVTVVSNQSQWTLSVADIDNNGFNDVITAGDKDNVKLMMADALGEHYSVDLLPGSPFFAQTSRFVDINADGWLDAFICDDDAESKIWGNDGMGKLEERNEWIDMATVPVSDNSGNYGCVWTDFDNDGDQDLYIAKCRQNVEDKTDPRRINTLFVNDGQGNFTEAAAEYGLKIDAQSWTADFQDIDNDGDFDCLVTNHYAHGQLLENDGTGHFTDISQSAGIGDLRFPLQGVMRDFDNDGFVDILIAGIDAAYFFYNQGDKTFALADDDLLGPETLHSYAIGDLNHDGFLDYYASYANGFTTPSSIDDLLWINNGNSNNFLAVNLEGQQSNRNGIGARLEIYGDWGIQVREVRGGESYGIHNTFTQHFGLGANSAVDSLIVYWPSGLVDRLTNISANQFITLQENGCASPNASLQLSGPTTFCEGDSLIINAPLGLNYAWSTGANSPTITIHESGTYNVTVSNATACEGISTNVLVTKEPNETPLIASNGDAINCPGIPVVLTSTPANSYTWSTGATTQSIEVTDPGTYWVTIAGLCTDFHSDVFELETYDVPIPVTTNDTVIDSGSGILTATGMNLTWYDQEVDGDSVGTGPTFNTPVLTQSKTYWVAEQMDFSAGATFGGKTDTSALGTFLNASGGGMSFSLVEEVRLISLKVYADSAGERILNLFDSDNGNSLGSVMVDIPQGESRVMIDKVLAPSKEIFIFINGSPGLYQETDMANIDFPYPLGGFGQIDGSANGNYNYFYDWELEAMAPEIVCSSERVPATLVVDFAVATEVISGSSDIRLFPNPVSDRLEVRIDLAEAVQFQLMDVQGKVLLEQNWPGRSKQEVEVTNWARGLYFARIFTGDKIYFGKIILQ